MYTDLAGKRIVVGVSGSISIFKVAGWVSTMVQQEALIDVIMTSASQEFITPLTFEALTSRPVYTHMFSGDDDPMAHINLGRDCDCVVIAPASAQTIARLAHGLADDLLATTVLAANAPVIVCPAMNTRMYQHQATQQNLETLRKYGYCVVEPDSGNMACGDQGIGRLVEWERAVEHILRSISPQNLSGQRVLVTAGPTRETIDPARFLSNRSSGKMGYAVARGAFRRGAEVTLITGPTSFAAPEGVELIEVTSAQEMYDAVMSIFENFSIIVKTAAVSDFRPVAAHREKIKKEDASLVMELIQNKDILKDLGKKRNSDDQLIIGFAAESSDIEEKARGKLLNKSIDLIAVNDIISDQTGFATDTNQLTLITAGEAKKLPLTTKQKSADLLWDYIVQNNLIK